MKKVVENELKITEIVNILYDVLKSKGFLLKRINTFEDTKFLLKNIKRLKHSRNMLSKKIVELNKSKSKIDLPTLKKNNVLNEKNDISHFDLNKINQEIVNTIQTQKIIDSFIEWIKNVFKENLSKEEYDMMCIFYEIYNDEEYKESICKIKDKIDNQLKRIDVIALKYHYDSSTIYKKINNAINSLHIELFPEKFIKSIYLN